MFCWHRWKIINTEILPSIIEQMADAGLTGAKGYGNPGRKPAIVTKRCEKCGAETVVRV